MLPARNDTIAAISTPPGDGAIGIVRISGAQSLEIIQNIFKPFKQQNKFESHKLIHGKIYEGEIIIDDALACVMAGEHSYTGEDLVEIHGHGGSFVLSEILNLILKSGARLAEAGEFTYRALLHGKLDLTQAEAVFDVIHAKSKEALYVAQRNLKGDFSKEIKRIREELLELFAHTEASIDFSTEDIEVFSEEEIQKKLNPIAEKIAKILNTYNQGRSLLEGIQIAIVGKPNVGKSSLLNALLNKERAIVTPHAGTTRDTIEESISYKGLQMKFIDTAGIRNTEEEIEKMGVAKSLSKLNSADVIYLVMDQSQPLTEENHALLDQCSSKKTMIIFNKSDLEPKLFIKDIQAYSYLNHVSISALNKVGVDELLFKTHQLIIKDTLFYDGIFLTKYRHKVSLEKALYGLNEFKRGLKEKKSLEFLALDLKEAVDSLESIIGKVDQEDIYDKIFSTFCIGK